MTPYLDNRCHKLRLVSRRTTLQDLRVLHKHAHRLTLCYMAEHKLICLPLVLVARAKTSLTLDFNVKIDVLADVVLDVLPSAPPCVLLHQHRCCKSPCCHALPRTPPHVACDDTFGSIGGLPNIPRTDEIQYPRFPRGCRRLIRRRIRRLKT